MTKPLPVAEQPQKQLRTFTPSTLRSRAADRLVKEAAQPAAGPLDGLVCIGIVEHRTTHRDGSVDIEEVEAFHRRGSPLPDFYRRSNGDLVDMRPKPPPPQAAKLSPRLRRLVAFSKQHPST